MQKYFNYNLLVLIQVIEKGGIHQMLKQGMACAAVVLFCCASVVSALENNKEDTPIKNLSKELLVGGHIAYIFALWSGLVEFYLNDPGNLTIYNGSSVYFITGADFAPDGSLYCVNYNGGLYEIDITTGIWTIIAPSTIACDSLVYDTTTDIWYIASGNALYTMDITDGSTTLVGSFGTTNYVVSLMCDSAGNMYGYDVLFSGDSHLYSIDKATGAATAIGDMGYDFCYAQEGKFDRDNGILYIAGYFINGSGNPSALLTCDTQTGACTIVGYFEYGVELDGLAIPYGESQYPYSDFTWIPSDPHPGETIVFNASTSYDPDGYITMYEWDWNHDGVYEESHTTPTATHSWATPGNYIVTLRVMDNSDLAGRKSKTVIIVNYSPEPPIINGPTNGTVNRTYTFPIHLPTDPDGDEMFLKWDWGDGNITEWLGPYTSGQTVSASHAWTYRGVYAIRAKLKDTYGAESNWSDPHIITITDNNPPATPTITGSVKGKPGVTYLYTFETTDPETDDIFYYIDWGDNTTTGWLGSYPAGVQKSALHSWSQKGAYIIKIKAKDTWGAESDWGTLSVTIPCLSDIPGFSFLAWFFTKFPHALPIFHHLLGFDRYS